MYNSAINKPSIKLPEFVYLIKLVRLAALTGFIFLCSVSFAQKEAYNWHFGYNAALNFSTVPPSVVTGSSIYTRAGCASISDSAGNLLFYTDGMTVWNKINSVMYNGNGLLGNNWAVQSAVIIPQPGNVHVYYIFTTDITGRSNGLKYSIIDMRSDHGLGAVTSKNISLLYPCCDKITAIKHSNGKGVWVITHAWNSNAFYTFLLDNYGLNIGINNPVISNTGTSIQLLTSGYMKASPDGTKLAITTSNTQGFSEIYEFDNKTGIISKPARIKYNHSDIQGYGIEFSPNGQKLYISFFFNSTHSILYQFDISIYDSNSICNSGRIIWDTIGVRIFALQVAPDKKIYASFSRKYKLGVINSPDNTGLPCNFVWDGLNIGCSGCLI